MKIKTSVTLSKELLEAIEKKAGKKSRSDFIENAVWLYLKHLMKQELNSRDLAIINANAAELNSEAMDALDYQEPI
ncbi:MAG: ribbon-helix-helix domain-containing protein [Calditrichia bacterium]